MDGADSSAAAALLNLPRDLHAAVLSRLPQADLKNVRLSSRALRHMVDAAAQRVCLSHVPTVLTAWMPSLVAMLERTAAREAGHWRVAVVVRLDMSERLIDSTDTTNDEHYAAAVAAVTAILPAARLLHNLEVRLADLHGQGSPKSCVSSRAYSIPKNLFLNAKFSKALARVLGKIRGEGATVRVCVDGCDLAQWSPGPEQSRALRTRSACGALPHLGGLRELRVAGQGARLAADFLAATLPQLGAELTLLCCAPWATLASPGAPETDPWAPVAGLSQLEQLEIREAHVWAAVCINAPLPPTLTRLRKLCLENATLSADAWAASASCRALCEVELRLGSWHAGLVRALPSRLRRLTLSSDEQAYRSDTAHVHQRYVPGGAPHPLAHLTQLEDLTVDCCFDALFPLPAFPALRTLAAHPRAVCNHVAFVEARSAGEPAAKCTVRTLHLLGCQAHLAGGPMGGTFQWETSASMRLGILRQAAFAELQEVVPWAFGRGSEVMQSTKSELMKVVRAGGAGAPVQGRSS
ncbi:unnamed protein product [Pedinophyceae sp. YPF-701]|nr:unnamed protein product [Pedinophyceae sp. YPF-701]